MATHYVTFRYNGNGSNVSGVPSASSSYYNNTSGQYPYTVYKQLGSAPSRAYFTFKGWARSSGSSSGSAAGSNYSVLFPNAGTTSLTFDFYATWEHVTVYVHYNANGGTGAPASQSHWGGYSVVLTTDKPTRSGYNFLGWSQQSDATSASYLPGGDYALYTTVTLYAVWSPANSSIASVSQNVPIDGATQGTLNITRYNSSYTHDVTFKIGSSSFTINNVGTSTNFTIPVSWLSEVPNATSAYATVSVVTKSGSSQVGQVVTASFSIVVPSNIVPSVTITGSIVNDNSVVDAWGILLQGYSKVSLSASGVAGTGASIASYTFSGLGVTQSGASSSAVSAILNETGNKTWTVTVTDSRGRTASATYTNTIYAYSNPSISDFSAIRANSEGVRDEVSGANLSISASFVIASCNENNQYTNAVAYKAHSASTWQDSLTDILSNYTYVIGNEGIDIDKTFDVRFTLSDSLGNTATYIIEVQSVVGYSFGLKNDRVRFGGVVQKPGFQNDLDLEQNGDAVFNANVDIANRRCHARLNSAGWYRAIKIANEGRGGIGFVLDINITRSYSNANNEVHKIHLLGCWNNFVFTQEASRANTLRVSKMRYTRDADNNGYVDIYFNSGNWENVSVDFVPHTQSDHAAEIMAESLQAVADAPSGETIVMAYNILANTDRSLTVTNSNCTARFYAVGGVKAVRISDPKGLTANAVTTLVSASEMTDYMPVGSYIQDCVSMNSAMERVRFYVDSSGIRAYNYSSNTGTLNMELTITYV